MIYAVKCPKNRVQYTRLQRMPLLALLANRDILQDLHNEFILMLQVQKNNLNLLFCSDIHLKIGFGSIFSVAALKILTDHDQRHQKYLNHV